MTTGQSKLLDHLLFFGFGTFERTLWKGAELPRLAR